VQVLQWWHDAVRRKRRYKRKGPWFLHHDNARTHISLVVQQIPRREIYSCQYPTTGLFPILKMGLKGTRFTAMARPNSGRFQTKPSTCASNNGRIDGASMFVCVCACVCAQASYFVGDWLNVAVCPTITVQYHHSGNFLTAHLNSAPVATAHIGKGSQ
jgi:hypothetical protein